MKQFNNLIHLLLSAIVMFLMIPLFSQPINSINGNFLNRAVPDGRVDSVWRGISLPSGFSGKDVIIGVTDWGFDYTHPVFYDTNMVNYRVLAAWDQFRNGGTPPEGFNYGTEIVGQEALLDSQCDTSNIYFYGYHATHVSSIAGGAGAGTPYRGVAYDANFLFCTFLVDESAVIDGFLWMYKKAQEAQKRLVINMSWGLYYMGNLDGTGRLADTMQSLSDRGVIFVTSAGNNGDTPFHLKHTFEGPEDTLKSAFSFDNSGNHAFWGQSISMTNSPDSPYSFAIQVMNNSYQEVATTPFYVTQGEVRYIDTLLVINSDTLYYNISIDPSNAHNNRPEVRLRVKKPTGNYRLGLIVTAVSGTFHAYNVVELSNDVGNWGDSFVASASWPGSVAGDYRYGLGMPASVPCAITVAAHCPRYTTTSNYTFGGQIAYFSSYGPTIDDRFKPEISAPGHGATGSGGIMAALSSFTNSYSGTGSNPITFNGRTYRFASLSGTSMSSPFVTGVVALILQANPYLSTEQIKQILCETARQDEFTAQSGTERFGYGKVNAYAAIKKALSIVGVQEYQVEELRYTIYPNPTANQICVSIQNDGSKVEAILMNVNGIVVKKNLFTHGVNELDLSALPSGVYLLKLVDKKHVEVRKIVKM